MRVCRLARQALPTLAAFSRSLLKIHLPMHNLNRIALGKRGYWQWVQAVGYWTAGLKIRWPVPKRRSPDQLPDSRKNSKIVLISLRSVFLSSLLDTSSKAGPSESP